MPDQPSKILYKLEDVPSLARKIVSAHGKNRIYVLTGDLGAGKTTLVSEMAQQMGVKEPTSSPTFSIVNEYQTLEGDSIYHIDAYRLKTVEEAIYAGLEEILYKEDTTVFVEWPQVLEPILPLNVVHLELNHNTDNSTHRYLTIHQGLSDTSL